MAVVWTRSSEDWHMDELRLDNIEVCRIPCNKYEIYSEDAVASQIAALDIHNNHTLIGIVTSQRAASCLLSSKSLRQIVDKCESYLVVGEKTFKILNKKNLKVTWPKDIRSAKDLADFICQEYDSGYSFFYPGPKERAYPLDSHLSAKNYHVYSVNLYETKKGVFDDQGKEILVPSEQMIRAVETGVTCFASTSSVLSFYRFFKKSKTDLIFNNCRVVAIGKTTYKQCKKYFTDVRMSQETTLESLIFEAKRCILG